VQALLQIPEAQRPAIVLHHLADLPVDEVARLERCPSGTVKARLSRGRAALALLLTDDLADEPNGASAHV
jgi:RNA polymerase sigma-70 factor (ECF subfamily)